MNTSTKIALAVAGGYVLGRRKKVKLAVMLGSVLLGKRLDVRSLGREAMSRLADSPEVGQIRDDLRGQLASTGRAAATAAMSAPLNKLADRLHERTAGLSGQGNEQDDRHGRDEEAEPDDEARDDEGREDRDDEARDDRKPSRSRGDDEPDDEQGRSRQRRPARPRGRETGRPSRSRAGARRSPAGAGSRSRS